MKEKCFFFVNKDLEFQQQRKNADKKPSDFKQAKKFYKWDLRSYFGIKAKKSDEHKSK